MNTTQTETQFDAILLLEDEQRRMIASAATARVLTKAQVQAVEAHRALLDAAIAALTVDEIVAYGAYRKLTRKD